MNAKSQDSPKTLVDSDEAPELTEAAFAKGSWKVGDKVVSRKEAQAEIAVRRGRGRPAGSGTKVSTTIRFDAEVLEAFRGQGEGWQTRMNDVLKEWLATHRR